MSLPAGLTGAEALEARERWEKLKRQFRKVAERDRWLYENQDDLQWSQDEQKADPKFRARWWKWVGFHGDEEWEAARAATVKSEQRFAELWQELAGWCGVPDVEMLEMVGAMMEQELQ